MTRYPKAGKGKQWTVRELECVPVDWQKDTLADGKGLFGEVRLTKEGAISIRFRYAFRWEGKTRWYQCGMWPAVSLAQIRKERDRARQQVTQGVNPCLAKQAARIEAKEAIKAVIAKEQQAQAARLTVSELFKEWINNGVNRADGNAVVRRNFEKDALPVIGAKPVAELTDKDLYELLRGRKERIKRAPKKGTTGDRSALILADDIKQMLRWAEKRQPWRGLLIAGNPADLLDLNALLEPDYQKHRERILSADEISALHTGLLPLAGSKSAGSTTKRMRFAIWLCLSTLCRIGELVAAKWEHIDWQAGTWFIPAANTKGKRGKRQGQQVILSGFALEQFRQLYQETGDSVYCFPNKKDTGHTTQPLASVTIAKRQGEGNYYPALQGHWTLHDMRRTGATMMQGLGIPLEVIDRCQNHVLAGAAVRRHYLHYDYAKEKGAAWRALGEHLEAIIRGSAA